jgi:hypothetical protein
MKYLLLLLIPIFSLAQNPSSKILLISPQASVNVSSLPPDFLPSIVSLEAPFPGANPDKIQLALAKKLSAQKFPRSISALKSNSWGTAPNPTIIKGYDVNVAAGIPPDNYLAVSNNHRMVTVVNSNLYVTDSQADTLIKSVSLTNFTPGLGLTGFNNYRYDPKIIYDSKADRFIAVILNGVNNYNWVILAFSESPDPAGNWNLYKLTGNPFTDTTWFDYPAISLTEKEFFLTGNQLRYNSSWQTGFKQSVIYQIRKEDGYNGLPLTTKLWSDIQYNGKPIRNLHPVKGGLSLYGPGQYFLSNRNFAVQNDTIFLLHINDTVNSPTALLDVKVIKADRSYGVSPSARQPLDSVFLATNDGRVLGAYFENNEIQFVSNSIDTTNGSAAIYHGIITGFPSGNLSCTANILSMDTLDFGYPNISCAGIKPVSSASIISFDYSGPNSYPGLAAARYEAGGYSDFIRIKQGISSINALQGLQRWGDYSGSQPFFPLSGAVWVHGLYGKNNAYGNHAALLASPDVSVESVEHFKKSALLFPNPAESLIQIRFENPEETQVQAEILDLNGRLIYSLCNQPVKKGMNMLSFTIEHLSQGVYVLTIKSKTQVLHSTRFVKK